MVNQKVEFRKIREFGENLSDTFLFIRVNLKSLLLSFLGICGVFMLGHAIFNGIYQSRSFGLFDQFRSGIINNNFRAIENIFNFEYFLTLLLAWMAHVAMEVALASYIKLYVERSGVAPAFPQVWEVFRRNFPKVFLFTIPVLLLIIVGFMFCLIPGIYFAVVLVPFSMMVVIEGRGFGDAFNRCFEIIRDNFWLSFAIYLVAGLIYSFSATIIGVMVGVVVGLVAFFTTNNLGATTGIVTSLLNVFSGVFYIIFFVSAALQYYSLVEKRDGTGILQKIENIGSSGDQFDNVEKQY